MKKISAKVSMKIYRFLPIYLPRRREYGNKLHLAIWCCGDCMKQGNLWYVLKATRITIRKGHKPILVLKKGEV